MVSYKPLSKDCLTLAVSWICVCVDKWASYLQPAIICPPNSTAKLPRTSLAEQHCSAALYHCATTPLSQLSAAAASQVRKLHPSPGLPALSRILKASATVAIVVASSLSWRPSAIAQADLRSSTDVAPTPAGPHFFIPTCTQAVTRVD